MKGEKKDKRKGVQRGGRPPKKTEVLPFDFSALKWNTIKASRESMTAILTAFGKGELAESKLRPTVYTSKALLAFLESERELEVDRRLEALEKLVQQIVEQKK